MEVDSQFSVNKTLENKSIPPFIYVYKRIITKENQGNLKNELDSLNFEKIAKYKMKRMNLRILLDSIVKVKNSLNKNSPFLKYIKDTKPYIYYSKKIVKAKREPILEKYINKNNYSKKEKCINFSKNNRNFYYSRMCNIDCKKINNNKIDKILLIQKHIRGFLRKKIVDEEVNKIIAKRIINKILTIQRAIKRLLSKKNSLDKIIVNIIKDERNSKSNKITDIFSMYHYRNLYKKNLIKNKILKIRNNSILLIQRKFRSLLFAKNVKEILKKEKKSYILTYPFKAESVQMKLYINSSYKIYKYFLCPIRKYFILYIDKGEIKPGEYVCQMIVNNNITLDKRYKYTIDKRNDLFNIIYIGQPPLIKQPKEPLKDNLRKIKYKEDKKAIKNDENPDEFYYYCYNDASNSTNSYSSKSEHEKNKLLLKTEKIRRKENSIFNKEENQKINDFLKSYKKPDQEKVPIFPPKSRFCNFVNINKGNINKKNISMKRGDFDTNFKEIIDENETGEHKLSLDIQSSKKDGSIHSQQVNYNNILDELNQSVSSIKSNSSIKNINSYSIKIHQTKFSSNQNKNFNKISLNTSDNSNNITINSTVSYRK